MTNKTSKLGKYVLITTEWRGVFAGKCARYDEDKRIVTLKDARCAIDWMTRGGFLELAEVGPNDRSKIGSPAIEVDFQGITSVTICTEKAEKTWREHGRS